MINCVVMLDNMFLFNFVILIVVCWYVMCTIWILLWMSWILTNLVLSHEISCYSVFFPNNWSEMYFTMTWKIVRRCLMPLWPLGSRCYGPKIGIFHNSEFKISIIQSTSSWISWLVQMKAVYSIFGQIGWD